MFGERTRKVPGSARHQCGGGPVPSTGRVKPGQLARLRTTADKDTRNQKRKDAQEKLDHVKCEGKDIENVWIFKYLGSRFRADGDQTPDIKARMAAAATTAAC